VYLEIQPNMCEDSFVTDLHAASTYFICCRTMSHKLRLSLMFLRTTIYLNTCKDQFSHWIAYSFCNLWRAKRCASQRNETPNEIDVEGGTSAEIDVGRRCDVEVIRKTYDRHKHGVWQRSTACFTM